MKFKARMAMKKSKLRGCVNIVLRASLQPKTYGKRKNNTRREIPASKNIQLPQARAEEGLAEEGSSDYA